MMKALVGARVRVTGRRRATVSAGPMPGRTPTAVPRLTPANAQRRFEGAAATENPITRDSQVLTGRVVRRGVRARAREPEKRVSPPPAASEAAGGADEEDARGDDEPGGLQKDDVGHDPQGDESQSPRVSGSARFGAAANEEEAARNQKTGSDDAGKNHLRDLVLTGRRRARACTEIANDGSDSPLLDRKSVV